MYQTYQYRQQYQLPAQQIWRPGMPQQQQLVQPQQQTVQYTQRPGMPAVYAPGSQILPQAQPQYLPVQQQGGHYQQRSVIQQQPMVQQQQPMVQQQQPMVQQQQPMVQQQQQHPYQIQQTQQTCQSQQCVNQNQQVQQNQQQIKPSYPGPMANPNPMTNINNSTQQNLQQNSNTVTTSASLLQSLLSKNPKAAQIAPDTWRLKLINVQKQGLCELHIKIPQGQGQITSPPSILVQPPGTSTATQDFNLEQQKLTMVQHPWIKLRLDKENKRIYGDIFHVNEMIEKNQKLNLGIDLGQMVMDCIQEFSQRSPASYQNGGYQGMQTQQDIQEIDNFIKQIQPSQVQNQQQSQGNQTEQQSNSQTQSGATQQTNNLRRTLTSGHMQIDSSYAPVRASPGKLLSRSQSRPDGGLQQQTTTQIPLPTIPVNLIKDYLDGKLVAEEDFESAEENQTKSGEEDLEKQKAEMNIMDQAKLQLLNENQQFLKDELLKLEIVTDKKKVCTDLLENNATTAKGILKCEAQILANYDKLKEGKEEICIQKKILEDLCDQVDELDQEQQKNGESEFSKYSLQEILPRMEELVQNTEQEIEDEQEKILEEGQQSEMSEKQEKLYISKNLKDIFEMKKKYHRQMGKLEKLKVMNRK